MSYAKSRNLALRPFDDPIRARLKIRLDEIGEDGANTPPALTLARRGIVGFKMWDVDSVDNPQGRIIDAVGSDRRGDRVGTAWRLLREPLSVRPERGAGLLHGPSRFPFVYDISMRVRPEDDREPTFTHWWEAIPSQ